ncbi:VOC family protein [Nocardioides sp. TF02-7]|uniref:VOC family protein n=1 Tax=Nocardioides sp. TF02-7 TaxID=2917724 RepID=UPI001F0697BF|nr:VOC family protein [Nocardioides sp. TF02-7]UMG94467.1 VOC family protein [Nocardioides sp. TF02-7]
MLRGLTTTNFYADDVAEAGRWYTHVLGVEPYFVREVGGRPAYIEFRVGDLQHELGFIDRRFAPPGAGGDGTMTYWAVDDVHAAHQRLLDLGATEHQPPARVRPGLRHRLGGRPVRQRPRRHVQPALPRRRRGAEGRLRRGGQ